VAGVPAERRAGEVPLLRGRGVGGRRRRGRPAAAAGVPGQEGDGGGRVRGQGVPVRLPAHGEDRRRHRRGDRAGVDRRPRGLLLPGAGRRREEAEEGRRAGGGRGRVLLGRGRALRGEPRGGGRRRQEDEGERGVGEERGGEAGGERQVLPGRQQAVPQLRDGVPRRGDHGGPQGRAGREGQGVPAAGAAPRRHARRRRRHPQVRVVRGVSGGRGRRGGARFREDQRGAARRSQARRWPPPLAAPVPLHEVSSDIPGFGVSILVNLEFLVLIDCRHIVVASSCIKSCFGRKSRMEIFFGLNFDHGPCSL
jgi:hypothetical protein